MELETNSAPIDESSHTEFAKELGLTETISIAVGAMIGGGIFTVLGRIARIAGPAATLSFLLGGIIAFLTSNSYYRLVAKYPSAGGEFVILRRGFDNPLFGNVVGAMLWLGYSVTIALYAFTFGLYTSEYIYQATGHPFFNPESTALIDGRKIFAFISILIFMVINLRGVKETGLVQNVIVGFKLAVLWMVGMIGFIYFRLDKYFPFTVSEEPYFHTHVGLLGGLGGMVIGSAVIFVSYEGFQVIANTVEEMKNPARDVKLGMYISIITVTLTYIIVTIAAFSLVKDPTNMNEAALIQAVGPVGSWAVLLVTLGAMASTTSAINATLLGSSRLAYVMSDYTAFPKRLAVISKKSKVPFLAIIITSTISWAFTFFGNANEIAEVGSIIFLGIYLSINYAVIRVFPKEKNKIAKTAATLIIIYIALVIGFFITHITTSHIALVVLGIFSVLSIGYMGINQYLHKGEKINPEKYFLEPLGKELIPEFSATGLSTDVFFIDLENMLIPTAGELFETMNWHISAQICRKYNVKADILHIGNDESKIQDVKKVFELYEVNYNVILKPLNGISETIIETYQEGNYQLISMGSRRTKGIIERILDKSVSKNVVDNVDCAVLQVHPSNYGLDNVDIDKLFMLLDGSERDYYLGRWAKIVSSVGSPTKCFAYHIVTIPQTISLEDAANFSEIKRSALNFELYAQNLSQQLNLDSDPTLLYGHNFVKSLVEATQKHQPDVVIIGHTKDTGFWNQIRTRLAYRIMRAVDSAVIVYHMQEIKK